MVVPLLAVTKSFPIIALLQIAHTLFEVSLFMEELFSSLLVLVVFLFLLGGGE